MSWPLIKYVLTAAVRDRLVIALLVLLGVGMSLAVFMGSAAFVEKEKFSMVFAAGGLRIATIFGLVLFVVFFMRRSFESRDIEALLSRPVGRVQFLLSYAAAFSVLATILALAVGVSIVIVNPLAMGEGHILWTLSLIAENIIMVNTALFFSMVVTSASTASMVTFAFYILARMMGQILGIIDAGGESFTTKILSYIMQFISLAMPRLDLMGQTSWLIYGPDANAGLTFIVLQGAIFTFLIIMASLFDLNRRQF